jgi:hypothetical protein
MTAGGARNHRSWQLARSPRRTSDDATIGLHISGRGLTPARSRGSPGIAIPTAAEEGVREALGQRDRSRLAGGRDECPFDVSRSGEGTLELAGRLSWLILRICLSNTVEGA